MALADPTVTEVRAIIRRPPALAHAKLRLVRHDDYRDFRRVADGQGTSLTSRFMWARVKAEAERDLMARFAAVCWRPASIDGVPSASHSDTRCCGPSRVCC